MKAVLKWQLPYPAKSNRDGPWCNLHKQWDFVSLALIIPCYDSKK